MSEELKNKNRIDYIRKVVNNHYKDREEQLTPNIKRDCFYFLRDVSSVRFVDEVYKDYLVENTTDEEILLRTYEMYLEHKIRSNDIFCSDISYKRADELEEYYDYLNEIKKNSNCWNLRVFIAMLKACFYEIKNRLSSDE